MVQARMVAAGPRGGKVPSEVIEAAAAPLVLGARAPAVGHFIHWQLRGALMQQGVEIGAAFAKVRASVLVAQAARACTACEPARGAGSACLHSEACVRNAVDAPRGGFCA